MPGSFPLTHAGWAASTVATLVKLLPQNPGEIRVELFMAPSSRGRSDSQSNAAEGVVGHRQVFRRITVPGTPENTPLSVVWAALLRDPISIAYHMAESCWITRSLSGKWAGKRISP